MKFSHSLQSTIKALLDLFELKVPVEKCRESCWRLTGKLFAYFPYFLILRNLDTTRHLQTSLLCILLFVVGRWWIFFMFPHLRYICLLPSFGIGEFIRVFTRLLISLCDAVKALLKVKHLSLVSILSGTSLLHRMVISDCLLRLQVLSVCVYLDLFY